MATNRRRAVIYARYSSENQNDRSVEDQVALCRRIAEREGLEVTQVLADRAISGASTLQRPGFQELARLVERRGFEVLIAESLSRLSRNLADLSHLSDRLKFAQIQFVTEQYGVTTDLHIGLLGTMAQMQLTELAETTRRGQRGLVSQGRIPGGLAYGYRALAGGRTGEREVVEDEAVVVREIFTAYANGLSANTIARQLNARGVAGPRSGGWNHTTICGHRDRGTGILNNRLYIGEIVFGTTQWRKNPDTGRRVAMRRDDGPLERTTVEALRIVDQSTWDRVQARHAAMDALAAARPANPLRARQPGATLLSGKLACGICGHSYQISGKDRFGCTGKRIGRCDNGRTLSRQVLEDRILAGIRDVLLAPEAIAEAVEAARQALAAEHKAALAEEGRLRRKLGEIERALKRWVKAIGDGAPVGPIKDDMHAAEAERMRIQGQLASMTTPAEISLPHPALAEACRRKVAELADALRGGDAVAQEAVQVIRESLDRVVIQPASEAPDGVWLEISGALAGLLTLSRPADGAVRRVVAGGVASQLSVDAGTGFEPVTFRL